MIFPRQLFPGVAFFLDDQKHDKPTPKRLHFSLATAEKFNGAKDFIAVADAQALFHTPDYPNDAPETRSASYRRFVAIHFRSPGCSQNHPASNHHRLRQTPQRACRLMRKLLQISVSSA